MVDTVNITCGALSSEVLEKAIDVSKTINEVLFV